MPSLKVIVDAIFAALEANLAGRPMLLMFAEMLHQLVLSLLPQIAAQLKEKGIKVAE